MWNPTPISDHHHQNDELHHHHHHPSQTARQPPSPTSALIARSKEIMKLLDTIGSATDTSSQQSGDLSTFSSCSTSISPRRSMEQNIPQPPTLSSINNTRVVPPLSSSSPLPPLYQQPPHQHYNVSDALETVSSVSSSVASPPNPNHRNDHHHQYQQQQDAMLMTMFSQFLQQQQQQSQQSQSQSGTQSTSMMRTNFRESQSIQVCENDLSPKTSSSQHQQTERTSTSNKFIMTEDISTRSYETQTATISSKSIAIDTEELTEKLERESRRRLVNVSCQTLEDEEEARKKKKVKEQQHKDITTDTSDFNQEDQQNVSAIAMQTLQTLENFQSSLIPNLVVNFDTQIQEKEDRLRKLTHLLEDTSYCMYLDRERITNGQLELIIDTQRREFEALKAQEVSEFSNVKMFIEMNLSFEQKLQAQRNENRALKLELAESQIVEKSSAAGLEPSVSQPATETSPSPTNMMMSSSNANHHHHNDDQEVEVLEEQIPDCRYHHSRESPKSLFAQLRPLPQMISSNHHHPHQTRSCTTNPAPYWKRSQNQQHQQRSALGSLSSNPKTQQQQQYSTGNNGDSCSSYYSSLSRQVADDLMSECDKLLELDAEQQMKTSSSRYHHQYS